jgi:Uncharacterized protein conserved in bacteria (DUF2252)
MKNARKMTIRKATASYEAWLGEQIPLQPEGLERKHELMQSGVFPFLRGTYYRWVQLWSQAPRAVRTAREVLAVGDLHVENFGTWRDAEGRLVWGVNDFDEAFRLPYTNDLVRLATSARLAVAEGHLTVNGEVEDAVLAGYREGLEAGGRPFVLAEHWKALRRMALEQLEHPDKFWDKLGDLPTVAADQVPRSAVKALGELLPGEEESLSLRYVRRAAGLGSLGRQRFVVIADWCGGKVAREAKALARSASLWANEGEDGAKALYREILDKAVRAQDPFVTVKRRWIARRLAPDCVRIELAELQKEKEAERLLHAMGWETANVHLGSATAPALLLDLVSRPDDWLHKAVEEMLSGVREDWEAWKKEPAPAKD